MTALSTAATSKLGPIYPRIRHLIAAFVVRLHIFARRAVCLPVAEPDSSAAVESGGEPRWRQQSPSPLRRVPNPEHAKAERHTERSALTLHVPPNYSALSQHSSPFPSPRPILKPSRAPSEESHEDMKEDHLALLNPIEREHVEHVRKLRFNSVPEVLWIECANRKRDPKTKCRKKEEEPRSSWETWFSGMNGVSPREREQAFATRLRYDQLVC